MSQKDNTDNTTAPTPISSAIAEVIQPATPPIRTCVPPIPWSINEFGLWENVKYIFNENGSVNWRKMIDNEYIVPNRDKTTETDISKLEDKDLLIKLFGFRSLAKLRRTLSETTQTFHPSPEFVSSTTTIVWAGNYETGGVSTVSTGSADAHAGNTNEFVRSFLTTIAENRSFVRAVRNYLGIPVLGQDEIGNKQPTESGNSSGKPIDTLKGMLEKRSVKFQSFKNRMIKEGVEGSEAWTDIDSVSSSVVFECIEKLSEIFKQKDATK